ncbi:GHMP family kinase ATP-binding protein [Rubrobacter marinus]|uniref:GHMP family kinase ATP-binding protein n=1 Tax=Rubrobacter marinus TaxID=2653852 RepID=UPI00140A5D0D|nr:kinase [Rubrobacter marinus]
MPISRYSTAGFVASRGSSEVRVHPPGKEKSRRLAEKLVRILAPGRGGSLYIRSELPTGKGCASSSADMVATARAVQRALGTPISRAALARAMSSIEPSDGVMYPGIVSFYHREGVLRRSLGGLPPLTIVGLDEGGRVDTVEFNERARAVGRARLAEYEDLLVGMERAVASGDLRSLGEISTRSAVLNQERLPKENLGLMLEMRRAYGALGVVVAHSGTHLGLLFDSRSGRPRDLSTVAAELARHGPNVCVHQVPDLRTTSAFLQPLA